jgi:hypothetical protein
MLIIKVYKIKSTRFLLFILLSCSQFSFGQILQTRAEIIEKYGTYYTSGTTEGTEWLKYEIKVNTKESGTYNQGAVF